MLALYDASERLSLLAPYSPRLRFNVYVAIGHYAQAASGMTADARMVANRCRGECRQYKRFLGDMIPGGVLCDRIASYFHLFTLYWFMRPMGAGALLAVVDKDGPQLYGMETSGQAFRYYGTAIGKGRQSAKTEIERLKLSELSCREAVKKVAKILHNAHEEKEKGTELELSWICPESNNCFSKVPAELHKEADREARQAIEDEQMGC